MAWRKTDEVFINPYNFIDIGNKCKKENDVLKKRKNIDKEELLTGVIDCSLITKTPIFIPNTTNSNVIQLKNTEHKSYDFFSYENLSKAGFRTQNPVIPGSSIRGVIRSAYEALTDSCFSVIDNERVLYKRMPDAGQPAIIRWENGKVKLYKSEKFMIKYKFCDKDRNRNFYKELINIGDGTAIWIRKGEKYPKQFMNNYVVSDISLTEKAGYEKCYLIKGGDFIKKHHYSAIRAKIFEGDFIAYLDIDNEIKKLSDVVKLYEDKKINQNIKNETHDGFSDYKKALEKFIKERKGELPVYYKENKTDIAYYLSPACITKEVYNNSVKKILNNMGSYNSCNNIKSLCEACNLFGMVGENSSATNSKLRFTDAKPLSGNKEILGDFITLKELASPKISATEFYLHGTRDDIWTYDYSGNWRRQDLEFSEGYKAKIRGRKFYWNHKDNNVQTESQSKRNVTVRPVKSNNEFEFKVFFERVTRRELMRILWTLSLGENYNESSMQHKIGMGKSIGLGSIKIKINSVTKREVNLESDKIYSMIDISNLINDININECGFNNQYVNQVKIAFNANTPKARIQYPDAINIRLKRTNFSWFIANKAFASTGTKPKIHQTLPKVTDKNITLFKYKEEKNNNYR